MSISEVVEEDIVVQLKLIFAHPLKLWRKKKKKDEKPETKAQQSEKNDNPIQDTEDIWENNQHLEEKQLSQQKEHEDYQVKIEDIIYDPPGSDTNKESITLLLTKGEGLDLKKTTLVIDGKNKKINGILKILRKQNSCRKISDFRITKKINLISLYSSNSEIRFWILLSINKR